MEEYNVFSEYNEYECSLFSIVTFYEFKMHQKSSVGELGEKIFFFSVE